MSNAHRIPIRREKSAQLKGSHAAGYVNLSKAEIKYDPSRMEDVVVGAELRFHDMGYAPEMLANRGDYFIDIPEVDMPLEVQLFLRAAALSTPEALQSIPQAKNQLHIAINHDRGQGRKPRLELIATYGTIVIMQDRRIEAVAHVDEFFNLLPEAIEAFNEGEDVPCGSDAGKFRGTLLRLAHNDRTRGQVRQMLSVHERRRQNKSFSAKGISSEDLEAFMCLASKLGIYAEFDEVSR